MIVGHRPPAYWPSSTSPNADTLVEVEKLVIRYAPELPPVLHGVSFQLKAKERVGLLGRQVVLFHMILSLTSRRTGSGKSTLAMSLLRFVSFTDHVTTHMTHSFVQVDPAEGKIVIDGIDISSIGLHDLRSRIACFSRVVDASPPLISIVDFHSSRCRALFGHYPREPRSFWRTHRC